MREPYRVFFPLGVVFGLGGVAIWPLYEFGITATYSGRAHAFVQTFGFLYAFVAGFLLTAVPRLTGTPLPARSAQWSLAGLITLSVAASELRAFAIGTTSFVAAHVMLLALVVPRFVRRRQNPPATFVYIGLALIAGLAGGLLTSGVSLDMIDAGWDVLGKRLLTEGMVMLLVLGVGGFLGPRLLGFTTMPPELTNLHVLRASIVANFVAGSLVLLSLFYDYAEGLVWMAYVRAAVITVAVLATLRLWHRPTVRTTLSWTVWLAHWAVVVGVWLVAAAPRYRADFLHIVFVGGFSLLIFAVATRVTLSHGQHDLGLERRSWPLRIGLTLALIAMLARIGAPFASATYFVHLSYAALLWMSGVICWGGYIVTMMRKS